MTIKNHVYSYKNHKQLKMVVIIYHPSLLDRLMSLPDLGMRGVLLSKAILSKYCHNTALSSYTANLPATRKAQQKKA